MAEKFIISKHIPLETARKDKKPNGIDDYDENDMSSYSEYHMALALQNFKVGQVVTHDEFAEAVHLAVIQETLSQLVDTGMCTMSWNGDEPVYFLTDKGKSYVETLPKNQDGD